MARLLGETDWKNLPIIKQMGEPYQSTVNRRHDYVRPLLGIRPIGAEEFTDHDIRHSTRVLERITQILPDNARLNDAEIYVLTLAALLHDSGMWTSKQEALSLLESDDFALFCDQSCPDELSFVRDLLKSTPRRWMAELALQRLAAIYNRKRNRSQLVLRVC